MKRSIVFIVFFLILGFALAGLYWSQRRPNPTPVSAIAILDMAADAQRRPLPYTFIVLPNHSMMNAFSLPGGPVYIGEGLLDLMMSEDELANVLAHEIEHIDHYHCVERVRSKQD
jgi:Zn-dependent protease with chaperone function